MTDDTRARADGWRPIATAPRDGTDVLLWVPASKWGPACAVVGNSGRVTWHVSNIDGHDWEGPLDGALPTHWMPLPAPPASEEGER